MISCVNGTAQFVRIYLSKGIWVLRVLISLATLARQPTVCADLDSGIYFILLFVSGSQFISRSVFYYTRK